MCLPVYYERLVLQPKQQMQRILKFLGITWHENVIHHEQAIGVKGGISLSKYVFINNRYNMLVNLSGLCLHLLLCIGFYSTRVSSIGIL